LGRLTACADSEALVGLWFVDQKHYPQEEYSWIPNSDHHVFKTLRNWLNDYFAGSQKASMPQLNPYGTDFQKKVWDMLRGIPYGEITTYRNIAKRISMRSARAIGGAISHNPISILIPCHRVVGANGKLIGYAGGINKKKALINLEKTAFLRSY
jgi:methylated-DNA-[protein]-cysteine S-methyltransferase